MRNKNKKLVKRPKIITQRTETVENLSIIDIKSVTIEHSKTSHKLSKNIKQAKKFSQVRKFFEEIKTAKKIINKQINK